MLACSELQFTLCRDRKCPFTTYAPSLRFHNRSIWRTANLTCIAQPQAVCVRALYFVRCGLINFGARRRSVRLLTYHNSCCVNYLSYTHAHSDATSLHAVFFKYNYNKLSLLSVARDLWLGHFKVNRFGQITWNMIQLKRRQYYF